MPYLFSKLNVSIAMGALLAGTAVAVAATPGTGDGPMPPMRLRATPAVTASAVNVAPAAAAPVNTPPAADPVASPLPDAPDTNVTAPAADALPDFQSQNLPRPGQAVPPDDGVHRSRYRNVIDPGETVPVLGVSGKLILSMKESVAPFTIIGTVAAAGINHLDQGDPQYGEGSEAFGKRVGAAFALEASGNIFSDGILASAFREDPRYYRDPDGTFTQRVFHPIKSVFVTKTDNGNATPNFSSLIGLAGAAFLTQVYYPPHSNNDRTSLNTYGYSLAGLAAANMVSEFFPDIWHKIHHPQD